MFVIFTDRLLCWCMLLARVLVAQELHVICTLDKLLSIIRHSYKDHVFVDLCRLQQLATHFV